MQAGSRLGARHALDATRPSKKQHVKLSGERQFMIASRAQRILLSFPVFHLTLRIQELRTSGRSARAQWKPLRRVGVSRQVDLTATSQYRSPLLPRDRDAAAPFYASVNINQKEATFHAR
jgi:hypothetical protein